MTMVRTHTHRGRSPETGMITVPKLTQAQKYIHFPAWVTGSEMNPTAKPLDIEQITSK